MDRQETNGSDENESNLAQHVTDSVEAVAKFHQDHYRGATRAQNAIDRVTDALGRPLFAIGLVSTMAIWTIASLLLDGSGIAQPSFAWLELLATLLALIVSVLILVTQSREDQLAERRAELILELALLSDRKSAKIIELLEELRRDMPSVANRIDAESEDMQQSADPSAVLAAIDEHKTGE